MNAKKPNAGERSGPPALIEPSVRAGNSHGDLDLYSTLLNEARERTLDEKTQDALTAPGFAAAFDPDEAERMGAFVETALSEEDAIESAPDLLPKGA